jgi:hypothetical protein
MNESQLGALGEHLVIAELLQRGFHLATPIVDVDGFDLLVSVDARHFSRIQIKTSRQPHYEETSPTYRFNSGPRLGSDFYILCCLFHKTFYIIPTSEMPKGVRLSGDGSGRSSFEKNLSAFNLLSNKPSTEGTNAGS